MKEIVKDSEYTDLRHVHNVILRDGPGDGMLMDLDDMTKVLVWDSPWRLPDPGRYLRTDEAEGELTVFRWQQTAEVMVVEVKDKGDWLSAEQRANMIDLHALGLPTFVWTPGEGLMAYPKIQDNLLLTRLELAYELEQVKADRDDLLVAKEQLHTQLATVTKLLESIRNERQYRRLRFGRDFKVLRRWVSTLPDLPFEITDMLKHYEGVPGAAT